MRRPTSLVALLLAPTCNLAFLTPTRVVRQGRAKSCLHVLEQPQAATDKDQGKIALEEDNREKAENDNLYGRHNATVALTDDIKDGSDHSNASNGHVEAITVDSDANNTLIDMDVVQATDESSANNAENANIANEAKLDDPLTVGTSTPLLDSEDSHNSGSDIESTASLQSMESQLVVDGKQNNTETLSSERKIKEINIEIPLPNASQSVGSNNYNLQGIAQLQNFTDNDMMQQDGNTAIRNGYTGTTPYHTSLPRRKSFIRNALSPKPVGDEPDEDGWVDMHKKTSFIDRALALPVKIGHKILPRKTKEPGTLILVRHGESEWNANKTFTGWADPDLSPQGCREVEHAARLMLEGGYEVDVVFTSRLKRAIRSTWIILLEMNEVYLPVFKSWRLNERFYGALTGLCKKETAELLGHELVQEWRGSLRSRPPPLASNSPHWPGRDRKYADLKPNQIPTTESLMDCMERTAPLWEQKIIAELKNGRNVMVVAHANTLRGLVKTIDNISDEDIREVAIPTGIPIIYKFDQTMKAVPPEGDKQTACQLHMKGLFLEKPGLLKEALKREQQWSQQVPGYNPTMGRNKTPMTPLERSLYKLRAERELKEWAGQFVNPNAEFEDDGSDGNSGKPIQYLTAKELSEDNIWENGMQELRSGSQFDPDLPNFNNDINGPLVFDDEEENNSVVANILTSNQPCVSTFPASSGVSNDDSVPTRQDACIVIIRHGKTEHNKLGLFTGWEDAPLAKDGVIEAREAGRLLKAHGFEFDVVYTSWLSRAIDTAWHVIDEMDALWLPIIKTWRLNERMYGQLTGLSKQMVKQRHGEKQFKAWRRGYNTPPPPVSSFSPHYPGNDRRYQKYLSDVRISVRESTIRSIEQGKLSLHRKYPKSESLKDCMDRTVPYFVERIVPQAIEQGKRVLISSSENAIRGLLMHLCEIPEDKITGLEIPNGLPIVFDLKSKCVKLLDDGTGRDPLEVHSFGKAASYLFRPCLSEDGTPDEECDIRFSFNKDVEFTDEETAAIEAIKKKTPMAT